MGNRVIITISGRPGKGVYNINMSCFLKQLFLLFLPSDKVYGGSLTAVCSLFPHTLTFVLGMCLFFPQE